MDTKPPNQPTHRLLYRGALSLPDSHMFLDGLSFTAALQNADSDKTLDSTGGSGVDLLNHPLALALESMRGRPSLHFLGTVKLSEVWIDEKSIGAVSLDIHPQATLSRRYFETIFCLEGSISANGRSEYGARVSLSDSDDPDATDILIYAQLSPGFTNISDGTLDTPSTSTSPSSPIRLLAARILPGPPPAPLPPRPRPDDATPRLPPLNAAGSTKRKRDVSPIGEEKRSRAGNGKGKGKDRDNGDAAETLRKARETMMRLPKPALEARATGKEGKKGEFKVPKLPHRADSIPDIGQNGNIFSAVDTEPQPPDEQEKANKIIIKQAVVRCLADHSITKQHEEFHDLYQNIYRGACFALRTKMRAVPVDLWSVFKLVDAHAKLYVLSGDQVGLPNGR